MASTPNGSVVDEVNLGEEDPVIPPKGAGKASRPCGDGNPSSGVGACPCKECTPCPPESPNPIDQLVAALCDAGFNTNPRHRRCHGLDADPASDEDKPKVKIPPPVFKGVPGERPDAHLLAAADWMEAMQLKPHNFIDNFKHTLQHLACEWYHSLDIDKFHGNWCEFTTHFSRYFSTQGRNSKHLHERW